MKKPATKSFGMIAPEPGIGSSPDAATQLLKSGKSLAATPKGKGPMPPMKGKKPPMKGK